jgi:hypothetical protein
VAVLRTARNHGTGEPPGGHDWLEVTALTPLEPEPVELLVDPEVVEVVELVELEVAATGVADWVAD